MHRAHGRLGTYLRRAVTLVRSLRSIFLLEPSHSIDTSADSSNPTQGPLPARTRIQFSFMAIGNAKCLLHQPAQLVCLRATATRGALQTVDGFTVAPGKYISEGVVDPQFTFDESFIHPKLARGSMVMLVFYRRVVRIIVVIVAHVDRTGTFACALRAGGLRRNQAGLRSNARSMPPRVPWSIGQLLDLTVPMILADVLTRTRTAAIPTPRFFPESGAEGLPS